MKVDVYQQVTDRIIAALEQGGIAPWRRPWVGGGPVNVLNGRPYRGINVFLLEMMNYTDPRWGTFKATKEAAIAQAQSEGREIVKKVGRKGPYYAEIVDGQEVPFAGGVRRGEKATHVILWKPVVKKRDGEEDESYLFLKTFAVFNVEQCDGIPEYVHNGREHTPHEAAEQIVVGYVPGPTIAHRGDRACYSETLDLVQVPTPMDFESMEGYYSTLFHELVHSTGHKDRLARLENTGFGTGPYAKEELVAEMGAAMLCGHIGIENLDQSASYVDNWLGALQRDKKFVIQAAALAQRACDLMLGTVFEEPSQEPEKQEGVTA